MRTTKGEKKLEGKEKGCFSEAGNKSGLSGKHVLFKNLRYCIFSTTRHMLTGQMADRDQQL